MSNVEQSSVASKEWYYEKNGTRHGPISSENLEQLITSKQLTYGSMIWNKDFQDWQVLEQTEFVEKLKSVSPPPLTGSAVKNTVVWVLAFAPIIGLMLEFFIGGALWGERRGLNKVLDGDLWYVTVILNLALSYLDEQNLRKAGCDTSKFKGFVWLIPVYLYQRATVLKQSKAYFIAWLVSFIFILLPY